MRARTHRWNFPDNLIKPLTDTLEKLDTNLHESVSDFRLMLLDLSERRIASTKGQDGINSVRSKVDAQHASQKLPVGQPPDRGRWCLRRHGDHHIPSEGHDRSDVCDQQRDAA